MDVTRVFDPNEEVTLASGNNGDASWVRGVISPLDQKSPTGWLACLYGGTQTGDDWARVDIPITEVPVPYFGKGQWTYNLTGAQSMGVSIVFWIHDPTDPSKRADVSQVGGKVACAAGWNKHVFDKTVTQMFFYGENTTGTGLTAGTQYTWAQFQADALFSAWTVYRVTLEYGWEASGTFDNAWVADVKLNDQTILLKPDSMGTGQLMFRRFTGAAAIAATLAPKTPFFDLVVGLHLSAVPTTATQNLTINVNAGMGSAYDRNILTLATVTNAVVDLLVRSEGKFAGDDEIDVAWANTDTKTYGLTMSCRTVY